MINRSCDRCGASIEQGGVHYGCVGGSGAQFQVKPQRHNVDFCEPCFAEFVAWLEGAQPMMKAPGIEA